MGRHCYLLSAFQSNYRDAGRQHCLLGILIKWRREHLHLDTVNSVEVGRGLFKTKLFVCFKNQILMEAAIELYTLEQKFKGTEGGPMGLEASLVIRDYIQHVGSLTSTSSIINYTIYAIATFFGPSVITSPLTSPWVSFATTPSFMNH